MQIFTLFGLPDKRISTSMGHQFESLHPFVCKYCTMIFHNLDLYRKHTLGHRMRYNKCFRLNPRPGLVLDLVTSFVKITSKQMMSVANPCLTKPYRCSTCQSCFKRKCQLKEHLIMHQICTPTLYRCSMGLCQSSFERKISLIKHMQNHAEQKPFACKYCRKGFRKKGKLAKHVLKHDVVGLNKANDSLPVTQSHLELRTEGEMWVNVQLQEMDKQGTKSKKKHTCKYCLQSYPKLKQLYGHIRVHAQTNKCPICQKLCKSKYKLRSHVKKNHKEDYVRMQKFDCSICKLMFTTQSDLSQHLKKLHAVGYFSVVRKEMLQCEHCEKSFAKKKYLAEHMKRMHKPMIDSQEIDKAKHRCYVCQNAYSNKRSFKQHMKRKHAHDMPLETDSVGSNQLVVESGIQSKKKPYQCQQCEKSFILDRNLKQHISIYHAQTNKVKLFKCQYCTKSFVAQQNLSQHLLTHGDKPAQYKCGYCLMAYGQKSELSQHMIRNHIGDSFLG